MRSVSNAGRAGIERLAPHDLRRTCARLCHSAGGELEQIQFLLGHVSIQTTERYLGCTQRIRGAVNDRLGMWMIWNQPLVRSALKLHRKRSQMLRHYMQAGVESAARAAEDQ